MEDVDVEGLVERLREFAAERELYIPDGGQVEADLLAAADRITTLTAELEREINAQFTTWPENGVAVGWDEMAAAYHSRATAAEALATRLQGELEEALGDRDDYRERLHDLVMIDAEEWAVGGGPGFKDRREKAWSRARERFEP